MTAFAAATTGIPTQMIQGNLIQGATHNIDQHHQQYLPAASFNQICDKFDKEIQSVLDMRSKNNLNNLNNLSAQQQQNLNNSNNSNF